MLSISTNRRAQICAGLIVALGIGALPLPYWAALLRLLSGNEALWWTAIALLLLYVTRIERRALSSVGIKRFSLADAALGVAFGVAILGGVVAIDLVVFPALHLQMNTRELNSLLVPPVWIRLLAVTRAAFGEELFYRGYGIERLTELTGKRWLAAVSTWAVFTVEHAIDWGWAHLIIAGFGGALLTALYLWRRNLWSNVVAHWIVDGAGLFLAAM